MFVLISVANSMYRIREYPITGVDNVVLYQISPRKSRGLSKILEQRHTVLS